MWRDIRPGVTGSALEADIMPGACAATTRLLEPPTPPPPGGPRSLKTPNLHL